MFFSSSSKTFSCFAELKLKEEGLEVLNHTVNLLHELFLDQFLIVRYLGMFF